MAEIANHLKLNHGTCANIIKTLVVRDYLVKGAKKGYGLGPMIYFLTGDNSYSIDIINASREPLVTLMHSINENCMVGILRGDMRVSLHEAYAEQELQVINKREKKATQTASGRVLLAYLSEKKLSDFIVNYGLPAIDVWPGVQTEEDFRRALSEIREKGYAVQVARSRILGVAMPVAKNGEVIAGLGVFLPEFRFDETARKSILSHMQKTVEEISLALP
ncbi:IclR family transcriptional regulator [Marinilongibacter aquaticus]|uniref:IclR family transcriptional regulator n=1 Tax=Marinilongibacter aquaticus TaxID=2975157 RepID=UPI0021BD10E1|nr:IclR family transcriptional regulator C-terminal domain-containing protein [Marinilongibacter aquaticus]